MRTVDYNYFSVDFNKEVTRIPLTLFIPPNGKQREEWIFGPSITEEVGKRADELIQTGFYFTAEILRNVGKISFTLTHDNHPYGDLAIVFSPYDNTVDPDLLPSKVAQMIMGVSVEQRLNELKSTIDQYNKDGLESDESFRG